MPPASSTCALEATSWGTAGLCWMPVRKEVVSAEMSTAPASAVPMEAPRLVTVFWTPPTSPLCSSDTAETVTLPSWEASAPTPRPASSIGQVTISGPAPESSSASRITMPANSAKNPIWTTRRGEAFGKTLGTPTAASSNVTDSGSSRTPVATAQRPDPQHPRIHQDGLAAPQPLSLPPHEDPQHHTAGQNQPDHRRQAQPL